jgi:hypothetical protein
LADDICSFPGPAAPRCPGYSPAAPPRAPEHLQYLPFVNTESGERGCAHLCAMRTRRGGFRAACGHPAGNPVRWTEKVGRPVEGVVLARRAFAH